MVHVYEDNRSFNPRGQFNQLVLFIQEDNQSVHVYEDNRLQKAKKRTSFSSLPKIFWQCVGVLGCDQNPL